MELLKTGAYLVNGTEIIEDTPEAQARLQAVAGPDAPSKEEAAKGTIAYGILEAHNTSDNMEKLKIRFDKLTSHDITYVGIIQTARASGLEKFPMPYVLTNCHNSLCAVGGTINEDDHMFGLTCTQLLNTWSNKLHNFIIYITILEYCSDNRKSYVLWTNTFYWLSCHVDSNNTWHINIVSLV